MWHANTSGVACTVGTARASTNVPTDDPYVAYVNRVINALYGMLDLPYSYANEALTSVLRIKTNRNVRALAKSASPVYTREMVFADTFVETDEDGERRTYPLGAFLRRRMMATVRTHGAEMQSSLSRWQNGDVTPYLSAARWYTAIDAIAALEGLLDVFAETGDENVRKTKTRYETVEKNADRWTRMTYLSRMYEEFKPPQSLPLFNKNECAAPAPVPALRAGMAP